MGWAEVSKSNNLEMVRDAVNKLDVNERDARGRTPLMLFITNRMTTEGIELLLAQNIDLEVQDRLGDTALKKAVKFKQKEVISLLLTRGVSLQDPEGMTATAWYAARAHSEIADLLLDTTWCHQIDLEFGRATTSRYHPI
ncbi:ankyrin repeat domain-containing protein [Lysinibacillus sphaericus]|uniref:ankyrin repeat domain-containing protein n=1 Tax=Lysinibacillus sphaericus TaxID=1421 RepID=UPI000ACCF29A|nr:ankyrin repeat domain-containing protein [Lysinibacillus sphaericus]